MIKPILATTLLSCLNLNIIGSTTANSIEDILNDALAKGSIEIKVKEQLTVTPEIIEIVKQLNSADTIYKNPLLIFTNDDVIVSDIKKLNDTLAKSHDTITSL